MTQRRDSQNFRELISVIPRGRVRRRARELGVVKRRRKVDVVALVSNHNDIQSRYDDCQACVAEFRGFALENSMAYCHLKFLCWNLCHEMYENDPSGYDTCIVDQNCNAACLD